MRKKVDKVCEYCGKAYRGIETSRYCSHNCSNRANSKKYAHPFSKNPRHDTSLKWRRSGKLWQCPYQDGVECYSRGCSECGWNPKVAKARTESIFRKLGVKYGV